MKRRNIVSVCWGDHLVFGEGDGRLATPDALRRRMEHWRTTLGASTVHWRAMRTRIRGRFSAARGRRHPTRQRTRDVAWDDFDVVPRLARRCGLTPVLYVSLFDEGWPLAPKRVRAVSYHNAMHGRHVAWQSAFSRRHPEYTVVDRSGRRRQWGVLCLAYPQVRRHFCDRFRRLIEGTGFEGLFVCLRSQSRPADTADRFGFNAPVRRDFRARAGKSVTDRGFEAPLWRDLLGGYLTQFMVELRAALGIPVSVGIPRGDVLGPPLGNTTLQWRRWVEEGTIDALIINQNSSQCPSMGHRLWPMHRGTGYPENLPPLREHVAAAYTPAFKRRKADLYVARQWDPRSAKEERALLRLPAVRGLVFSSFRFDNPGPVRRGDWRA